MQRKPETRRAAPTALLLTLAILCGPAPLQSRAVAPSSSSSLNVAPAPSTKDAAAVRAQKSFGEQKSFGQLPASFEVNVGQADARYKFLWRGSRHTLLLGAGGATLAVRTGGERSEGVVAAARLGNSGETASGAHGAAPSLRLLNMKFVGANPRAAIEGEHELKGKVNYFLGNDPAKWRTNVATYAQVRYRNLYRGVDLVYHGRGGGLEYDFVLAPGADASSIRVRFEGAERLSVEPDGGLLVHTKAGPLRQSRPVLYQEAAGARREVAGGYVLRGTDEIGFRVGEYDRASPLVIDPVIVYSTYLLSGGRMAVDPAGNVYVVGTTGDFAPVRPTPGSFQKTLGGFQDAFVAKLDAAGRELVYVTYLGGRGTGPDNFDGWEIGMDIGTDAAGNAYVTGITDSTDFPVLNAFQPAHRGGFSEGFVTKLNPAGSALVYSSFLGGTNSDSSRSIAVDAAGAAYLFGGTDSTDFPTRNALQPTKKGFTDYFVTKVAPSGSSLDYSTYLGGTGSEFDFVGAVAVDAAGAAYVAGTSTSADYPVTPNAFQSVSKEPVGFLSDAVVTKLTPDGSALAYSTYLGGTGSEYVNGIAVDAAGQAHVVGFNGSFDFPTLNPLDPTGVKLGGFLTKLNAAGTALVYSTSLAGTPPPCPISLFSIVLCGNEDATGVATDAAGNAYVTGGTLSKDFPAPVAALQSRLSGETDAFLIKLDPAGRALFSTYLGGSSYDYGGDVHADAAGTAYVFGATGSHDFPLVNSYRDNFARELDPALNGFLVKISTADPPDTLSRLRFASASFAVEEAGGSALVSVTREGDLSRAVAVDYATGDQTATERSDYTTARGTLSFAPGETTKSFTVFVTDDRTVEGDETLTVTLHDLRGAAAVLAAPISAVLTLRDDDDRPTSVNPIDDSRFFVRQHYLDFLGREPDAAGLEFWTNEIEQCGADQQCREMKRVNVSAAFFLSIEFQETGFLVERLNRLAFKRHVSYETFIRDARRLGEGVVVGQGDWRQRLDANRRAYAEEFVARAAFLERYPADMLPWDYVDLLNANSGGSLSRAERDALVVALEFELETRASVLLKIADDADFRRREFNPAFVLMQYLGYLRRDPEDPPDFTNDGYNFWLLKLDGFRGDWRAAEMVRAFVSSIEYRGRFNEPLKEAALGVPFTLGFRETAVVLPDKLRVMLRDIGFDSRCPRFAPCPSAGGLTILLSATRPGGDTAFLTLRIEGGVPRPHTNNPPVSALGYRFRLLQVDPAPPFTTPSEPYRALLQVEKE